MSDRESTFSDPGIIKRLQTEFIPVVGNTHELQNGRSVARDWFMKMATSVNERVTKGITAQGFYVAAADGKAYGFNNNRTVDRINWFMDNGLKKMKENPPLAVEIPQSEVDAAFCRSPGEGTSVLRIFTRIKPVPPGANKSNNAVARDHIWIYKQEALQMFATAQGAIGRSPTFELPKVVIGRLLRFHLVDNVRGEPDFWRPEEVKVVSFTAKNGRNKGVMSHIIFEGTYEMQTTTGARGLKGTISGEIAVAKSGSVEMFQAYGEATAWGAGTYTPNPPPGKFPMVFAIVQTNDAASKIVTPQAATWAGEYENPGLK